MWHIFYPKCTLEIKLHNFKLQDLRMSSFTKKNYLTALPQDFYSHYSISGKSLFQSTQNISVLWHLLSFPSNCLSFVSC